MSLEKLSNYYQLNKKTGTLIICVLVLCILLAVFVPLLGSAKAYYFDDHVYLLDNGYVKNPSWSSACKFFTNIFNTTESGSFYYQPVTLLSLMFDYSLAKGTDQIQIYHYTSLAIHIFNTFLVMFLIYLIFKNIFTSSIASLLFGLHPVAVECTAWISERKTLLATFFCLLALVFYIIYSTRSNKKMLFYFLSNILFIIALLSKPTVITLPFILLLMDFFLFKKITPKSLFDKIPFLIITIAFALITYFSHKTSSNLVLPSSYLAQIPFTISYYCLYFLFKTVFPVGLSSFYDIPEPIGFSNLAYLSSLIIFIALLTVIIISFRHKKVLFTGFMFFIISVFPALDLVRISKQLISFRFIYFPLIGIIFIIAWFINYLINIEYKHKLKLLLLTALTTVIIIELSSSIGYFRCWENSETLLNNSLKYAPCYIELYNAIGLEFSSKGQYDKAIEYNKKALKISPNNSEVYNNIATALFRKGEYSAAFSLYKKCLHINPQHYRAYYNIGSIFSQKGNLEDAQRMFNYTLKIKPDFEKAHIGQADILRRQGKLDEAIKKYLQILKDNPYNSTAYVHIGLISYSKKEINEAVSLLKKAISVDVNNTEAYHQLANILSNENQPNAAFPYYMKAMKLQPKNAEIILNYGKMNAKYGKLDEAINAFEKAIVLDTKYLDAHISLARVYTMLEKDNAAITEYNEALKINPLSNEAKEGLEALK